LEEAAKELLDQKLTEGEAITEVDEAELDLKQIMELLATKAHRCSENTKNSSC
jgi:hypothetical protein